MSKDTAPETDIKALAREIRAHGIVAGQEANLLLDEGETERAQALSEASTGLAALAGQLEAWRRAQASEIRLAAVAVASQRFALEDFERGDDLAERKKPYFRQAADMTSGVAQALEGIAQQLEPREERES